MKKKDVLFLCQFFYPEYVSSATLPYDTALALQKEGFSVGALCGYPKEYSNSGTVSKRENVNGISIKRLKYLQMKRSNFLGRLLNYFSFTLSVFLNICHFKNYKAVIVYSSPPILPWVAQLAKRLYKCKLIFVAYDLYPEIATRTGAISTGGMIYKVMDYINKRVYKSADLVVALSNEMREFLLENRPIEPDRIAVIPNWYKDSPQKERSTENRMFEDYDSKVVISYLGNMGICQDIETILQAALRLKDDEGVKFIFAGHGQKVPYIEDFIKNNNLKNVKLFGFLQGDDYREALSVTSLAVVSIEESLTGLCSPSKAYAYMMAGIPIMVIMGEDADLVKDAKDNFGGFWAKNGDVDAIINAVEFVRNNPEEYKQMSSNIRNVYLKKYETDVCNKQYVQEIEKLIK